MEKVVFAMGYTVTSHSARRLPSLSCGFQDSNLRLLTYALQQNMLTIMIRTQKSWTNNFKLRASFSIKSL